MFLRLRGCAKRTALRCLTAQSKNGLMHSIRLTISAVIKRLAMSLPMPLRLKVFPEPPVRFLILTPGRAGSSYLTELMNSHPLIFMENEILEQFRSEPDHDRRLDKQLAMAKEFYQKLNYFRSKAIGFKAKLYGHLWDEPHLRKFADGLRDVGVNRLLILLRRNVVKQSVSFERMVKLKGKHGIHNVANIKQKIGCISIDTKCLRNDIKEFEEHGQQLLKFAELMLLPTMTIYYEDLQMDSNTLLDRVFEFMQIPWSGTRSRITKHTSDDLSEAVENFEELVNEFKGTKYEQQLYEGMSTSSNACS